MKRPPETAPITETLRFYAETNKSYGKRLAQYLDWLEDCYGYTVCLHPDEEGADGGNA